MPILGFLVLVGGLAAIAAQVLLADKDNFLTPQQMMRHHGPGLPLVFHFGILWGDLFVITPLCAFTVTMYGDQWSAEQVMVVAVIAFLLSAGMHYQYLQDPIPNSHMHDGWLTPAAQVHFGFMWVALTVLGLFFLFTPALSFSTVVTISVLLWVHIVLGTHLVIKVWSPAWFPPQPIADGATLGVWVGSAVLLGGLSLWALR